MDCEKTTHMRLSSIPRIEVEFMMQNTVNSETTQFSYEDSGMLSLNLIFMLGYYGLMAFVIWNIIKYNRENLRYDTPYTGLLITLFFHGGGLFF